MVKDKKPQPGDTQKAKPMIDDVSGEKQSGDASSAPTTHTHQPTHMFQTNLNSGLKTQRTNCNIS